MGGTELKQRLGQILAVEEGDGAIDWPRVERLSNALLDELGAPALAIVAPGIGQAYLEGSIQRQTDGVFAFAQRGELIAFLRAD